MLGEQNVKLENCQNILPILFDFFYHAQYDNNPNLMKLVPTRNTNFKTLLLCEKTVKNCICPSTV